MKIDTKVTLVFIVPWTTKEEYKYNLAKELRKMADIIEQGEDYLPEVVAE